MKKIISLTIAILMLASLLAGCGSTAEAPAETAAGTAKVYNVGIVQLMQHVALDQATQGFSDALTEKLGDNVHIDVQLASGEATN